MTSTQAHAQSRVRVRAHVALFAHIAPEDQENAPPNNDDRDVARTARNPRSSSYPLSSVREPLECTERDKRSRAEDSMDEGGKVQLLDEYAKLLD